MHFKFLKIPIYIDLSFWIFLGIIAGIAGEAFMDKLLLAISLVFSVMLHKYGQAWLAAFWRADPIIILQAWGGRTEFNKAAVTDKQKFFITLAGPSIQVLWILIAYSLLKFHYVQHEIGCSLLYLTLYINKQWCLLNLIPIEPFDGGWLLRYLLEKKWGRKGYKASLVIGLAAAAIAAPYCYVHNYYHFLSIYLLLAGFRYCKLWQQEQEKT